MKQFIFFLAALSLSGFAMAQARAQADVSISSVTIGSAPAIKRPLTRPASLPANPAMPVEYSAPPADSILRCIITVHNENDDDANLVMMTVVVPVEVAVVSKPANATVIKSTGGSSAYAGYLVFNLGNMAVGQNITVEFTFTKSKYGNKVGAYAYSGTPDPNPANNYKDAVY